jgi:hypothetical protein
MTHNLFDRVQQASTSWFVKGVFIVVVILLFILPLYDLCTGNLSYKVWTMLVVFTSLLLYDYIMIYITGKWNNAKQLMQVSSLCRFWIMLLVLACFVALYYDFFTNTLRHPYWIPLGMAVLGLLVAIVRIVRKRIRLKKYRLQHREKKMV